MLAPPSRCHLVAPCGPPSYFRPLAGRPAERPGSCKIDTFQLAFCAQSCSFLPCNLFICVSFFSPLACSLARSHSHTQQLNQRHHDGLCKVGQLFVKLEQWEKMGDFAQQEQGVLSLFGRANIVQQIHPNAAAAASNLGREGASAGGICALFEEVAVKPCKSAKVNPTRPSDATCWCAVFFFGRQCFACELRAVAARWRSGGNDQTGQANRRGFQ